MKDWKEIKKLLEGLKSGFNHSSVCRCHQCKTTDNCISALEPVFKDKRVVDMNYLNILENYAEGKISKKELANKLLKNSKP